MKRCILLAAATVVPTQILAHDAGGVVHAHPHGAEALLALITFGAVAMIWGQRRS